MKDQGLYKVRRNFSFNKTRIKKNPIASLAVNIGDASFMCAKESIPGYLRVAPSSIDGAGMGVFADRDFAPRQPILVVRGKFVPFKDQDEEVLPYTFEVFRHPDLSLQVFHDDECNIIKYVNSAFATDFVPNVVILWHGCLPMLYATKSIPKGTELLLDYKWGSGM